MPCIFCEIIAGRADASRVYEDDEFLAFMDIYPWRPGHLLIIPKEHQQHVDGLSTERSHALFALGTKLASAVRRSDLGCDDLHFILNDGSAANQSVPHVHLHIVPRWRGDLWQMLVELAKRPVIALIKPAKRDHLDRQAAQIREAIS